MRNSLMCSVRVWLSVVLGLALLAQAASAQVSSRKELDEAYAQVLQHPMDRQITLNYARIALELKDYEAAIPPLERILMSEPGNARIKLQVGILYRALGSKLMARQYFADAAQTQGAPAEVVSEAEDYLHEK